ncbi:hypothetical protein B0H14DRAFT_3892995 [Mycena olivaceomarginata]|nr:hypothetical protein B0H14DRAFT_3892995 [Mycena olivaceomarginata]
MSRPSVIIPNSSVELNTIAADLNSLRESLEAQVPYAGGIHVLKPEDPVIYYDVDREIGCSKRIDLGNTREEDLLGLAAACDQATFEVNQKDVLDESYRKAGKMELSKVAAPARCRCFVARRRIQPRRRFHFGCTSFTCPNVVKLQVRDISLCSLLGLALNVVLAHQLSEAQGHLSADSSLLGLQIHCWH